MINNIAYGGARDGFDTSAKLSAGKFTAIVKCKSSGYFSNSQMFA
jgi:hypothetical protein